MTSESEILRAQVLQLIKEKGPIRTQDILKILNSKGIDTNINKVVRQIGLLKKRLAITHEYQESIPVYRINKNGRELLTNYQQLLNGPNEKAQQTVDKKSPLLKHEIIYRDQVLQILRDCHRFINALNYEKGELLKQVINIIEKQA